MVLLKFEKDRGHIMVDDEYITCFLSDKVEESRKYPRFTVNEPNIKLLHGILKGANMGKYMLTEKALILFDELVKEWQK